jgi:tetratricopeptide (TPR) repeat protein
MRGIGLCLVAVFGLLVAAPAWAGSAALQRCQSEADLDRRIGFCTQAIQSMPVGDEAALAHVYRGMAYSEEHQFDRAIADYNEALQLKPGYPEALFGRGYVYSSEGRYDLALQDFDAVVRQRSDWDFALLERCRTLIQVGRFADAVADCDKSIALAPGHAVSYESRGFANLRNEDPAKALEDFDRALAPPPLSMAVVSPKALSATSPAPSATASPQSP